MKLRDECQCECHTRPNIIHIEPCCTEMPSIKQSWETFKKLAISNGIDVPLECIKMAFYAGATQIMIYNETLYYFSDEAALRILQSLKKEYLEYIESIK